MVMNMVKQLRDYDFRYERKYLVENQHIDLISNRLNPQTYVVSECFPPREIHSFYYDTPELLFARQNIDGFSLRKKLRFRMYGDYNSNSKIYLELKQKNGSVGTKIVNSLDFDKTIFKKKFLHEWLPISLIPQQLLEYYFDLIPVIKISYLRRYFKDLKSDIRITLDTNITSQPVLGEPYYNQNSISNLFNYFILELKYPVGLSIQNSKFLRNIPFVFTRHSKYISGLEAFNLL